MARSGQGSAHAGKGTTTQRRPSQKRSSQRHTRPGDDTGLIPVLARAVREVENAAERGKVGPSNRTKFQVIALLMREERARAKNGCRTHRRRTHRTAEASRRCGHHPGQDRRARHLADPAARRRDRGHGCRPHAAPGHADGLGRRTVAGRVDHHQGAGRRRARGRRSRWCRCRCARRRWPTRSWRRTSAPRSPNRRRSGGWRTGNCSTRYSGRSNTGRAGERRRWTCRRPPR